MICMGVQDIVVTTECLISQKWLIICTVCIYFTSKYLSWRFCMHCIFINITPSLLLLLPPSLQAQAEELKPLIEQAAHQISAENTELACAFIQKTSMEKATPEMDKRLAEVIHGCTCNFLSRILQWERAGDTFEFYVHFYHPRQYQLNISSLYLKSPTRGGWEWFTWFSGFLLFFLPQEFELRKQARAEGRRYCNTGALTYQAERMPEQIRLNVHYRSYL